TRASWRTLIVTGLLLVPVGAGAAAPTTPTQTGSAASSKVPAVVTASASPQPAPATRSSSDGVFFWANVAADNGRKIKRGRTGPQRVRLLLDVLRASDVTLGALAELGGRQARAFRTGRSPYALVAGRRGLTNGVFYDTGK